MRVRTFRMEVMFAALFACANLFAAPPPSNEQVVQWLRSDNFAPLQDYFGSLQHEYSEGKIPEDTVRDAFRAFYDISPDLESHYDLWIQKYPKSYVAYLARAIYNKKVGGEARGDRFIKDTTDAQILQMREAYSKARRDLNVSCSLDSRPLLSYGHAIDIAMSIGPVGSTRQLLDSGLKLDSHSLILRSKFMVSLETRWGGSLGEMVDFLEESRRAGLSAVAMKELETLVEQERDWLQVQSDLRRLAPR
jgi:hypothetical protein